MPEVIAVHRSSDHSFSKRPVAEVELVEGLGVRGDAHAGATVQHLSRLARDPSQPNLRQVHLMHAELLDALATQGYDVGPGDLGENVTTRGLALLDLPVGTRLRLGDAVVTLTGLRNPCAQIDRFRPGLLACVVRRSDDGAIERLAGVMGVVSRSGSVTRGQEIGLELPPGPHRALAVV